MCKINYATITDEYETGYNKCSNNLLYYIKIDKKWLTSIKVYGIIYPTQWHNFLKEV